MRTFSLSFAFRTQKPFCLVTLFVSVPHCDDIALPLPSHNCAPYQSGSGLLLSQVHHDNTLIGDCLFRFRIWRLQMYSSCTACMACGVVCC